MATQKSSKYDFRDRLLGIELELAEKLCTLDYTQSGVHYISNPLGDSFISQRIAHNPIVGAEPKFLSSFVIQVSGMNNFFSAPSLDFRYRASL